MKLFFLSAIAINLFSAEVEYEIRDIGTLQTDFSEAIAINNNGQILGSYHNNGTKHYFVRDNDGCLYEIPKTLPPSWDKWGNDLPRNVPVDWKYLSNNGSVYGIWGAGDILNPRPDLYRWDLNSGIVKIGTLPGLEGDLEPGKPGDRKVTAINDSGQVLISSRHWLGMNRKRFYCPEIWENGSTRMTLYSSDESLGLAMNNKGEVVGYSYVDVSYRDKVYREKHATKWVNGKALDLHYFVPKNSTNTTTATSINDNGDVLIGDRWYRSDGTLIRTPNDVVLNKANKNYLYSDVAVYDPSKNSLLHIEDINKKLLNDSIWMTCTGFIGVNDEGEIVAHGKTVDGKHHAMLIKVSTFFQEAAEARG